MCAYEWYKKKYENDSIFDDESFDAYNANEWSYFIDNLDQIGIFRIMVDGDERFRTFVDYSKRHPDIYDVIKFIAP